jgi:hypothetical protein
VCAEEEKKLFSISMGEGGGLTLVVKPEARASTTTTTNKHNNINNNPPAATRLATPIPESPASSVSSGASAAPVFVSASEAAFVTVAPVFSCHVSRFQALFDRFVPMRESSMYPITMDIT